MSCAIEGSFPAAMASPVSPITNVWCLNLWMYGATERNQGTKVKLNTVDMKTGLQAGVGAEIIPGCPILTEVPP
jgi:hypothetical protein